jgi:hypothetical protein
MTILIPLLLAEVNFGAQYLSNPIIYGLNLELGDGEFSRNADSVLMFRTGTSADTGSLNVLQPNMNIDAQLKLVQDQLNFWLSSRDIRPNTIGTISSDNAVSGVNLLIQNVDAAKNVAAQADMFKEFEYELWTKLATIHNSLVDAGRIENNGSFTDVEDISISYVQNKLIETKSDRIDNVSKEINAGVKSKFTAIKELNPDWTDERVQQEVEMIAKENTLVIS